jgi:hypothetical protein
MMDGIFDACVRLLVVLANHTDMTYKAINVWVFVIVWPVLTLSLIVLAMSQWLALRTLRRRLADRPRPSKGPD